MINSEAIYGQSFGLLPTGTKYAGMDVKSLARGIESYDAELRPNMFGQNNIGLKALQTTTGGAGTAGYALVPVYVDPKIVDQSRKYTPLTEIIPRVTNRGLTADYNVVTAKGSAYFYAEGSALATVNDTYDRGSKAIKYLGIVGEVSGQAQAALPSYVLAGFQSAQGSAQGTQFSDSSAPDAMQLEVLIKARALKELEENTIINGNSSTSALEFDGLIKQIGTTNTVDKDSSALALDDINTAIGYAFDDGGRPNLAICGSSAYNKLLNLIEAKIGYLMAQKRVLWGFEFIVLNTMVGEVVVVPSMFMTNTSGSASVYFLDLTVIEMRVLQDMTYERLAKDRDGERFLLKMYECLIVRAPQFCASITEISFS